MMTDNPNNIFIFQREGLILTSPPMTAKKDELKSISSQSQKINERCSALTNFSIQFHPFANITAKRKQITTTVCSWFRKTNVHPVSLPLTHALYHPLQPCTRDLIKINSIVGKCKLTSWFIANENKLNLIQMDGPDGDDDDDGAGCCWSHGVSVPNGGKSDGYPFLFMVNLGHFTERLFRRIRQRSDFI